MSEREWEKDYEMEPEYDFSDGVPNPYAARYSEGTSVVVLAPDVVAAFPDSESVNAALRILIKAAREIPARAKAS